MPPHTVTCPSGLKGRVRGPKVSELNLFTTQAGSKLNRSISKILKNCWLETIDPGPYELIDGELPWAKDVLDGDRLFALIATRIAAFGPIFEFSVVCPKRMCSRKVNWEINLVDDLQIKPYPDHIIAKYSEGDRQFSAVLEDGKKIKFTLPSGGNTTATMSDDDASVTSALMERITEIDGVESNMHRSFIDDLPLEAADYVLGVLEESDGGVETNVNVQCGACGSVFGVDLPFDQHFWMPKRRKR